MIIIIGPLSLGDHGCSKHQANSTAQSWSILWMMCAKDKPPQCYNVSHHNDLFTWKDNMMSLSQPPLQPNKTHKKILRQIFPDSPEYCFPIIYQQCKPQGLQQSTYFIFTRVFCFWHLLSTKGCLLVVCSPQLKSNCWPSPHSPSPRSPKTILILRAT